MINHASLFVEMQFNCVCSVDVIIMAQDFGKCVIGDLMWDKGLKLNWGGYRRTVIEY